ncbi:hypothetical protein CWC16_14475 [Pseudoalteromonas sp. S3776]|uniref:hypothetical protein n=1 Tax=unclassified Pseudoalteromonas TaxID=194690 RepID=UPI0011098A9B|nr:MULTISPECIES: hypothetical protein [unclassified Pseudoalteromonas]TMO74489.1 hypothetical protein CWC17_08265 [Pseudoalteromonas sp. S3785]TMO78806.1 hypothetical protein CWC16_14475 [Pseudoalteromonas sp. S3776]
MHPRYAAIFGIENLELNRHYRPKNNDSSSDVSQSTAAEPLTLSEPLLSDIRLSVPPLTINHVFKGAGIELTDDKLTLPSSQLSASDKRALWALMSTHLDKL